ncbi:MAG: TetR family transcriptional regulator [Actinobacteria bacterium]|nr:TetR family transcriptional regulator [Actinomycetota bacterium]
MAGNRMTTETRKQQIIQAALETIGEYGVQGATISRIAKGAGITSAALYSHFENRRAILLAALDQVYEQILDSFRSSSSDDPVQRLREICEHHAEKVASQEKTSHAHLFLEFVASAREEGLREALREKELAATSYLAAIVREYKRQGRLPKDVDPEMIAWLIAGWAWTGDVASLMDVTPIWYEKVSSPLVELILGDISERLNGTEQPVTSSVDAVAPRGTEHDRTSAAQDEATYDGLPDGAVFSVEEAAVILKVSPTTIREMIQAKQIRSLSLGDETRIPRRTLVALLRGVKDDDLLALLERRTGQAQGVA